MSLRSDVEFLACLVICKDENKATELYDSGKHYEAIEDKFEISADDFCEVAEALIPYTPIMRSAILNEYYHGYAHEGNAIVKVGPIMVDPQKDTK